MLEIYNIEKPTNTLNPLEGLFYLPLFTRSVFKNMRTLSLYLFFTKNENFRYLLH